MAPKWGSAVAEQHVCLQQLPRRVCCSSSSASAGTSAGVGCCGGGVMRQARCKVVLPAQPYPVASCRQRAVQQNETVARINRGRRSVVLRVVGACVTETVVQQCAP